MTDNPRGIAAAVAASALWGGFPAWFHLLREVPSAELVAQRIVWTAVAFALLVGLQGRLGEVIALGRGPDGRRATLAALFIAVNWGVFVWAVNSGHAIQSSLGYYIFPLMAVLFGVIFRGERLGLWAGVAVALAAAGVAVLTWGLGEPPVVALILAISFASYGLLKSGIRAGAEVTVTFEALVLSPLALGWIFVVWTTGWQGGAHFGTSAGLTFLLVITGAVTGLPLMLFTWGSRRVRLSTLGMVQYLNPTLQAVLAVTLLGESLTRWHLIAFALIWTALAIFSTATMIRDRA